MSCFWCSFELCVTTGNVYRNSFDCFEWLNVIVIKHIHPDGNPTNRRVFIMIMIYVELFSWFVANIH